MELYNVLTGKPKYKRLLKRLFKQVFPSFERKPWPLLCQTAQAGWAELLAVLDSARPEPFCGLAVCLFWQDLVLLDYLAVLPSLRSQGLGRQILPLLQQRYPGRRLRIQELTEGGEPIARA